MRTTLPTRLLVTAGAALLAVAPLSAAAGAATPRVAPGWSGGAPLPPAQGTGLHRNEDGEPGMDVTPSGQFWVASDIAPYAADDPRVSPGGLLSGADVWTSTDDGRTYRWVADPFAEAKNSFGLAGEDTDLAVAPAKNANGQYNVYLASLSIVASGLAVSGDGGKTWTLNRLAGIPAQDRPWLAADGPCDVYLVYHQLPTFTPFVNKYDVCTSANVPAGMGATLDPVAHTELTLSDFPGLSNSFNKIEVDTNPHSPYRHSLYVPMSLCTVENPTDVVVNANSSNCPKGTQYVVAISRDGGQTFSYAPVVNDKSGATLVWAATMDVDAAGHLYFAWSDSRSSYLDVSTDGGEKWSKPVRLNRPGTAAVYPTVAAGAPGRVDVAWYGADKAGDSNDEKVFGKPGAASSVPWAVDVARSADGGRSFTVRTVTGTIHKGYLCTHGGGCSSDGSRNLLDDFGLAISPATGADSLAYTSDQPDGTAGHAFTGYTSERVRAATDTARRAGGSRSPGAAVEGRAERRPGRVTAAADGPLPNTGVSPMLALGGVALVGAGLALRRRVAG